MTDMDRHRELLEQGAEREVYVRWARLEAMKGVLLASSIL